MIIGYNCGLLFAMVSLEDCCLLVVPAVTKNPRSSSIIKTAKTTIFTSILDSWCYFYELYLRLFSGYGERWHLTNNISIVLTIVQRVMFSNLLKGFTCLLAGDCNIYLLFKLKYPESKHVHNTSC